MNNYYAKFNGKNERETSIALSVHFTNEEELQPYLDQGFVSITDEEQALYATNQYTRGEDGKPVKKPPYAPTTEEKMAAIRAKRDQFLAESDKYMTPDYPITEVQREAWKAHRQTLRDMPETCDPDNPVWPVKPD
ncbi:Phage tail assembly chaperone protein [Dendrosporobacter quercicolus]|uniref:Phage tail assembly chaperone protein n=1 Tax=Dendrosporobacter quercicolus TaxID=146817 RepID=A0A1G9YTU7_9FIRM|nr:tail fiber assembly protein [Dendrosporobacter quercicolus]SDN11951.1 Phage tail assembly chaperone protein [Dendrosporobacter quercicolus]